MRYVAADVTPVRQSGHISTQQRNLGKTIYPDDDKIMLLIKNFHGGKQMGKKQFDPVKSEAFAEKLITIFNSGALAVMTSIGHRTGLFDVMSKLPPSTSEQIALASQLNERYVREWLGALVVGRIIEYDPEGALYSLPPEYASWMTREAAPNNMSVFAQYISMIGTVEDRIIECFKRGGGVPYSEFKRFHQIMAEDSGQTIVAPLFDHILPLVPGLIERKALMFWM